MATVASFPRTIEQLDPATPTTSTTWAGRCCWTTSAGRRPCSPTTRAHPIRRSSERGGARCGSRASGEAGSGSTHGSATSAATPSGSTGRCRDDWQVETRTRTVLTATKDSFELAATLEAFEGDTLIHTARWDRSIPRDLV